MLILVFFEIHSTKLLARQHNCLAVVVRINKVKRNPPMYILDSIQTDVYRSNLMLA